MKKILALLAIAFLAAQALTAQPKLISATETPKFSIVYELNGGTNSSENPAEYEENAAVTLKAPTRANYRFDGWYWDSEFANKVEDSQFSQKTEPIKVYAKWLLSIDYAKFEEENMVEIIPAGQKAVLENFAGSSAQTVFGYSISKYEVTQSLFFSIMDFNPSNFTEGEAETHPVECVTWFDAVMFCNELTKKAMSENDCCYTITDVKKNDDGNISSATVTRDESKKGYRLPTEAEWEMAARGGVKGGWDYRYSGSDDLREVAWYNKNSGKTTHKVGTKMPNAAGLYDMSGNVCEWCDNLYEDTSSMRVLRGGSCFSSPYDYDKCSVSYRDHNFPNTAFESVGYPNKNGYGFRLCRSR